MRKSAAIVIIFFTFFSQNFTVPAQEFGSASLRKCWQTKRENHSGVFVASDNTQHFYVAFSEGILEAVVKNSGQTLWKSDIGGEILPEFIIDPERLYILSKELSPTAAYPSGKSTESPFTELKIHGLSPNTGITIWRQTLSVPPSERAFLAENTSRLLILTNTGKIFLVNKQNGNVELERNLNVAPVTRPLFLEDNLFFGTTDKRLIEISAQSGNLKKEFKLSQLPSLIFGINEGNIVIGDVLGGIKSLDLNEGTIHWQILTGAQIASITKVKNGLLVSSFDNFIYLLSERNGKLLWRTRISGRSIGAPLVKNSFAVFSTLNGSDAVFIDLQKGKTVNRIVIAENNYFLGNPVILGNLLLFPTYQGLSAFGSEFDCEKK